VLSVIWFNQLGSTKVETQAMSRPAVLVATHSVPAGTLLRPEDITWKEVGTNEIRAGNIVRGQMPDAEFVGAIARRNFSSGEKLIVSDLVRPNERQFLAAVLKPGTRAVSIPVDVPQSTAGLSVQSTAGLILPGDYVDVILTQNFDEATADPTRKAVAETVLRDVPVIAVDQSLGTTAKVAPTPGGGSTAATASRGPKTLTFALTAQPAEHLFVAAQLGRLQLSVRPLEGRNIADTESDGSRRPTWASDVSSAVNGLARKGHPAVSSVENLVRRPPTPSQPAVSQSAVHRSVSRQ
jgi:pilus assembly protein CpaB